MSSTKGTAKKNAAKPAKKLNGTSAPTNKSPTPAKPKKDTIKCEKESIMEATSKKPDDGEILSEEQRKRLAAPNPEHGVAPVEIMFYVFELMILINYEVSKTHRRQQIFRSSSNFTRKYVT